MDKCEKCPRCKAQRHRYVKRIRGQWTVIAVSCENCGYEGREIPMAHRLDNDAAMKAAIAWNKVAKRAMRTPAPGATLH